MMSAAFRSARDCRASSNRQQRGESRHGFPPRYTAFTASSQTRWRIRAFPTRRRSMTRRTAVALVVALTGCGVAVVAAAAFASGSARGEAPSRAALAGSTSSTVADSATARPTIRSSLAGPGRRLARPYLRRQPDDLRVLDPRLAVDRVVVVRPSRTHRCLLDADVGRRRASSRAPRLHDLLPPCDPRGRAALPHGFPDDRRQCACARAAERAGHVVELRSPGRRHAYVVGAHVPGPPCDDSPSPSHLPELLERP